MIIDFQHHFVPRRYQPAGGGAAGLNVNADGSPKMTPNSVLYDLDEHILAMDDAGIDAAFLTCPPAMCADLDYSMTVNDDTFQAVNEYKGRFIGSAHVNPLHGHEAVRELARCAGDYGFPGVVITSEIDGVFLDDPVLDRFWQEVCRLNLFVFIHPALTPTLAAHLNAYDMGRSIGREFSLIAATMRLINGGVLDRFPDLRILMSHLGGGLATMLGRIRKFQDREFFGTVADPLHGMLPRKELDYYLRHRLIFDTAGVCGEIKSVMAALHEIPSERIVLGTDYPQEIRDRKSLKRFIVELRELEKPDGAKLITDKQSLLLPGP